MNTDPSLPSYFSDGPIRTGIEAFDRAGGSSPLELVVADARNQPLDDDEMEDRLQALQRRLERHGDIGSVLSIALLMGEAERPWYSFLFSWETKLEQLDKPEHGRIGRTFISEDRRRARFIVRKEALADMWQPILASMLIVVSGFALFLLSDFPPTQRLGVLVCIGAALTDIVVLLMLPALATFRRRRERRTS